MGTNSTGCTEWERDFDPKSEQPKSAYARYDAQSALTKKEFNRLVELYNRRIEYDVIGIPYEEHRALGRALDILRPALSETKPL